VQLTDNIVLIEVRYDYLLEGNNIWKCHPSSSIY